MRSTATLASAIALGLCMLLLAACGGSDDGGDGGGDRAAGEDEAQLQFAECMREHGIDVPDPQPGGGPIQLGGPDAEQRGDLLNDPQAQEAVEACQDELGDAGPQNLSSEERQELEDSALRFAQCMRDNGVDVPDPQFEEGPGGGFGILMGAGEEADSPAFREAQEACEDELPRPPGGGAGPQLNAGPPGAGD